MAEYATSGPRRLLDLIDSFEALDVDSLWVSDRLVSGALTPRTDHISFLHRRATAQMKFGTSTLVLPTRNPDRPR